MLAGEGWLGLCGDRWREDEGRGRGQGGAGSGVGAEGSEGELKSEPQEEGDIQSSRGHLAEGKGRADSPRLWIFVQLSDFH